MSKVKMKLRINSLICLLILFVAKNNIQNFWATAARIESRVTSSADIATLQLAQLIFRHGDRTPFGNTYPADPYNDLKYWPEGWAQLTKKGKLMHYNLGKYLKYRYYGFLSKSYSKTEVHVRSSDTDRTIMSAQANLAGLFPPKHEDKSVWNPGINWQPIPIHTIPAHMDNLIRFGATCPRYNQLFDELHDSPTIKILNKENKALYEYISQYAGIEVADYRLIGDIYDTLFIQELYNLTLPDWTKPVYPEKLKPMGILQFEMISYSEEMKKLLGGPLLTHLIHNMEFAITPPKNPPSRYYPAKLQMYSGHDTTISAIMSTMGIYDKRHIPPYASVLMIELHKGKFDKGNGGGQYEEYFVRIYYRNDSSIPPLEFQIPNCIAEGSNGVCTLKRFKSLLSHRLVKNWEKECGALNSAPSSGPSTFYNRLSMTTGVVFFGLVILLGGVVTSLLILGAYMSFRHYKINTRRQRNLRTMFTVSTDSILAEESRFENQ